jgi:pantoate--beta-alanine ligase
MRVVRLRLRGRDETLGFVPTMGALHEGHLSLVDRAAELADRVVLSVFVNPAQFGPSEDFDDYPRDLGRDLELAGSRGADVVFAPSGQEMYPKPQSIWVEPGELANRLCGLSRPGHFRGVLTVVAKLFAIVEPDVAVFGRKDFQQAVLIQRMTEELGFPVRVEMAPIVREPDGLAMSSRNAYLTSDERLAAASLSRGLRCARGLFAGGEVHSERLLDAVRREMVDAGATVEYIEIVDPDDLHALDVARPEAVCAVAASVGDTRLIDNAPLTGPSTLDAVRA